MYRPNQEIPEVKHSYEFPLDPFQLHAMSSIVKGENVMVCAKTGSGKTLAFLIPILQNILINKQAFSALIILPSRELAFQITAQGELLGGIFGIKFAILTGGIDYSIQTTILKGKPNLLVSTPGRLVEHLGTSFFFPLINQFCFVID